MCITTTDTYRTLSLLPGDTISPSRVNSYCYHRRMNMQCFDHLAVGKYVISSYQYNCYTIRLFTPQVRDFCLHAHMHMKSKLRTYDSRKLAILGQQSAVLMLKRLQATCLIQQSRKSNGLHQLKLQTTPQ